jgi:acyl-CoA thioesterase FadM
LIGILIGSFFRPALKPLDPSILTLRVWPTDLDINTHMNNGRFLTVMDLGRLDLIARTPLGKMVVKFRWQPIVASALIRYFRPLNPFQKYQLRSRVVGWDEKWFYVEQRFERNGEPIAIGFVKGLFRDRRGNVPIADVLKAVDVAFPSPDLPAAIKSWQEAERSMEKDRRGDLS